MLLHIRVKPNSKTDSVSRDEAGTLIVKIRAQPTDGKANKYLVEYLSEIFRIPKSKIEIIKGQSGSYKTLNIQMQPVDVLNALHAVSGKL